MPPPTRGSGQTSNLRTRLSLDETRESMIAAIVQAYGETRNLGKAAKALGAQRRTLERAIADFPELSKAIDAARSRLGILV